MNGKYFIGRRVASFEKFNPEAPVTGVRLLLDDENGFEAGDMNGNVWEMENPYATQAMADNILAALKGKTYTGFTASAAPLGPEAELGDGVTVNGLYSVLAYQNVTFGPGHMSEIAAPGDDEPEEEYKYVPAKEREEARKLGKVRSYIAKTASEIQAMVEEEVSGLSSSITLELDAITGRVNGLGGQFSEFKNTVDGFTVTGPDGTTRIKGSSIETGSIAAGSIRADQVQLSGAITWSDLDSGAQGKVNTAQSTAESASRAASAAQSTANAAKSAASDAQDTINSWGYYYRGTTYIDGEMLMTGTVKATMLQGGTVALLDGSGNSVGGMSIATTMTGDGLGISTYSGGIRFSSAGNWWVDAQSGSFGMTGAGFQMGHDAIPATTGAYKLGDASHLWSAIYSSSGQIQTSDRELKHDIEPLPDKYVGMIDALEAVRYKYNDGTSDRYHVGFIAQEVKAVMDEVGIDSTEFGGYVADVDGEGKPIYMLRYEEFIGILWNRVRELTNRINALEAHNG